MNYWANIFIDVYCIIVVFMMLASSSSQVTPRPIAELQQMLIDARAAEAAVPPDPAMPILEDSDDEEDETERKAKIDENFREALQDVMKKRQEDLDEQDEVELLKVQAMQEFLEKNSPDVLGPVDALPAGTPKSSRRVRLRRGITVDSGSANNVMPEKMVRNRKSIRPSAGSIRRAYYVAANNGKLPNEGEFDFKFKTSDGQRKSLLFQVAEVNKALGSVSFLVDNGYRVTFDKDLTTGKDMSTMYHKESKTITRFRRDKNIWVIDAFVDLEDPEEDFQRHA